MGAAQLANLFVARVAKFAHDFGAEVGGGHDTVSQAKEVGEYGEGGGVGIGFRETEGEVDAFSWGGFVDSVFVLVSSCNMGRYIYELVKPYFVGLSSG